MSLNLFIQDTTENTCQVLLSLIQALSKVGEPIKKKNNKKPRKPGTEQSAFYQPDFNLYKQMHLEFYSKLTKDNAVLLVYITFHRERIVQTPTNDVFSGPKVSCN